MSFEIINTINSKSVIRIVGNNTTSITISDLSANTDLENITNATIAQISCVSDGTWRVYRGNDSSGVLMMESYKYGNFIMYEYDISLSNSSSSGIYITNSGTAGTMLMQLSKNANFCRYL